MVRKSGNLNQRPALPSAIDGHANGNPPPSTLAAQIVHNASSLNTRFDTVSKVTFGELVREFLQHPSTDEPDSQLIALVCVIAEAGFEGLFRDDPFAQDQQRQQGIDSIAVTKLIAQQRPHLLLSSKDVENEQNPPPPLFLWLFPKLLGILMLTSSQPVHEHVRDLLVVCLTTLIRSGMHWRKGLLLLSLYRSCVQHVLLEIDAVSKSETQQNGIFVLALPPSSCITAIWSESQQFVALPHDLQKTMTSQLGAIRISYNLLLCVADALCFHKAAKIDSSSCDHYVPWIMESSIVLWQHFRCRSIIPGKQHLHNDIVALHLQLMMKVAFPRASSGNRLSASLKGTQILANSLLDLLEPEITSQLTAACQVQLASCLLRLYNILKTVSLHGSKSRCREDTAQLMLISILEAHVSRFCHSVKEILRLPRELQLAIGLWTHTSDLPIEIADLRQKLLEDKSIELSDADLSEQFIPAIQTFRSNSRNEEARPTKRRRRNSETKIGTNESVYQTLVIILNGSEQDSPVFNLSNLYAIIEARYTNMKNDVDVDVEAFQSELLTAFSKVACAGSQCLEDFEHEQAEWKHLRCKLCDTINLEQRQDFIYWNDNADQKEDWKEVIAAMLSVTKEDSFQKSPKARILMATVVGRIFNHISDPEYLNLELCQLGQWLLSSMSRSLRELKLTATNSLMTFLRNDIPKGIREKNRRSTIEFLDAIAKRNVLSDQETLITAYGQIARICDELELPILLHHLIEYLGHPNALVCGMAYCELESIAKSFSVETIHLLSPYWKVIGFSVIKDIVSKPQKAQQLADLTEQSVRQLLILTQADTLPHLVLSKRRDVIEKIAQARKSSVAEVLTQPRANLAKILALLLTQAVTDPEDNAMETLGAIEPAMREGSNNRLEAWVALDITGIAIEILLLAADQEGPRKKPIYHGFTALAILADSKGGQRKASSKGKILDAFCETHILGIIAHFSDIIESSLIQGKAVARTVIARKRCIAAIGDLINLARYSVNGALPQIRACLQSAMADADLCDDTFIVWSAFLMALDTEDTMLVVDQTFALIIQHWEIFSEETQLKANKTILDLIQKHNSVLLSRIEYIPSLAGIPMMAKTESELSRHKSAIDTNRMFQAFGNRCKDQNAVVVRQTLKELVSFLDTHQGILHQSIVGQKPIPVLAALSRSILDASVRFSENHFDITVLCVQCLGIIGGLDPYRVETNRERKRVLMLSNFSRRDEDIDFVALLLEQVLVKVFLSTTNPKAQGWIAYVMQEMLKHCGFSALHLARPRSSQISTEAERWNEIPEAVRNVLTPFLSSRYSVNQNPALQYEGPEYPIYNSEINHTTWLQTFVYDLLRKGQGVNVEMVFPVLARIIRGYDLSIATFILPFAALNVIVSDEEQNVADVRRELLSILEKELQPQEQLAATTLRQCSENVFQTLDYLSLWLLEKKKSVAETRARANKTGRGISEDEEIKNILQISRVESILHLPPEIISRRAVDCGSYARALYHWEQFYRQERQVKAQGKFEFLEKDDLLQQLQTIYAHIDEPDSIEGISAHLKVLNPEQQVMEDRKAGRWTAAQSWYEIALAERPNDLETQVDFLTCLKESGQYESILNYIDGYVSNNSLPQSILPFAAEAAWSAGRWQQLERLLEPAQVTKANVFQDFNVGVGRALLALRSRQDKEFTAELSRLRVSLAKELSPSTTASIQACHDKLVRLHALYEVEAISGMGSHSTRSREIILENLDRRLEIIGAYTSDKQYLLALRRATMTLSSLDFTEADVASVWLTTGRLARRGGFITTAFNSVLHAERLGDNESRIEYSKLLWKEGHHRKAIQNLRGALESEAFKSDETVPVNMSITTTGRGEDQVNKVKCHAQLLLAKWLDRAGQTQSLTLKEEYQKGLRTYPKWDKGHYYLGRWYLKLLESEKRLTPEKQSSEYLAGNLSKLVIDNFVRSTVYGTKYYHQTLPKVLTLWLDMGSEVMNTVPRANKTKEFHEHRVNHLDLINKFIKRYAGERMPAFAWYTTFPQIITRISHPNKSVWDTLQTIIIRVAYTYPHQALWSLLAVLHSTQDDRRNRGAAVLQRLRDASKRKGASLDLKSLIIQGQRLTDALLAACDAPIEPRVTHVSLSKDLGFSHKLAPCQLVVPIEANMLPNLPAGHDSQAIRRHNPFQQDAITIQSFMDDVLVLSSLQRPRKLNVRGSDGRSYGLLCKPKDDLRKDQRLMEFNAMINRALRTDVESSKRRLCIKTYAVTPLNEECGTIEWVEGLKPMRDIIIRFYRQHNVPVDYSEIRAQLNEASSAPDKIHLFTDKILGKFQPVLHEWFVETFPEPEAWFAARLRYTRSCAVMSIIGHVLGLGDRHGENVLLEQGDGGTFHVDFNCLFDKGLTFEKPELVPFRLTHNMVDAMGPQGVEGPFRKAAELTYKLLRQHEDTLITILETFVHDPTADFLGGRKRKKIAGVPETPQDVLDITRTKVGGYFKGESVPLSVEGYVEALIQMATDPHNLAAMYIGWCAFF